MAASHRTALAAVATVTALTLAACNGSGSAAPAPSPTPTVAAPSPTPSPSPEPSPTPTEVLPANDVRDPVEALEAIVAYRDHLFENPDPDKLELIYAPRCDCYDEVFDVLTAFAEDGRRAEFQRSRVIRDIEVLEREGPLARIAYEADSPPGQLLDRSGTELRPIEEKDFGAAEVFLVTEGGRWRVIALVLR